MLKKKENSLYKVRGRKLQGVYFAFETMFAGYFDLCACPTNTSRGGLVALFSSFLRDQLEGPEKMLAALKPKNRDRESLRIDPSPANERAELRRGMSSSGASSSV
jgi:hypothetical protein